MSISYKVWDRPTAKDHSLPLYKHHWPPSHTVTGQPAVTWTEQVLLSVHLGVPGIGALSPQGCTAPQLTRILL